MEDLLGVFVHKIIGTEKSHGRPYTRGDLGKPKARFSPDLEVSDQGS